MANLAAVLVRSRIGARHDTLRALNALQLRKRHACVVVPDNAMNRGLMQLAKDFIMYGPINAETEKALLARNNTGSENVCRLAPPKGGYPSGGIKTSYQMGGALGLRAGSMDEFLKRML